MKNIKIRGAKSIPKAEVKNVIIELEVDVKEAAELLYFGHVWHGSGEPRERFT